MKTYNKFADYYDEIIRGHWYDVNSEVLFLDEMMKRYSLCFDVKAPWDILEYACGTGTIARKLAQKGYTIQGVDLSIQMIEKAQKLSSCKSHSVSFEVGDMTSINLKKEFDVVLCNYNSVCHLKDWDGWKDFFMNAYKHVKKDWIFIFDILTLFEFENITRDFKGFFNVHWDTICLEMFTPPQHLPCKESGKIYTWLIKMFVAQWNGKFDLVEEEIREISFWLDQITSQLEKTGFTIEHIEDFHFWDVTDESERIYFIAKK